MHDRYRRRTHCRQPLPLGLCALLLISQGSCSLLSSIAGSAGVPSSLTAPLGKLPAAVPGVSGSSPLAQVARATKSFGGPGLPALRTLSQRLNVPAALLFAKATGQALASHIEQRIAEKQRQQQATRLFYAGRCQLQASETQGTDASPDETQAEAAFAQGDYSQAATHLQRAAEGYEKQGPTGERALARVLARQSGLYLVVGQLEPAEAAATRSLTLRENVLGGDHPEVAESLIATAAVQQLKSDFSQAEPSLQRALRIREKALQSDHLCVAQTQQQLASLYQAMAAYSKAEKLYQSALATRQAKLGADSLDVAESKEALGSLAVAMGNYAEAEPLYETALSIRRSKLGPEDPAVAESLLDLGALQRRRGAYPMAEASLRQALAIREKKLAATDPRTAETLAELAALYEDLGDYRKAEPLLLRALALQEQVLGADHPKVADSLTRLAALQRAAGNLRAADEKLRRALQIRQTKLGAQHPSVADSTCDLGDLALSRGDLANAAQQYDRALAIRKAALGSTHPQVAATLHRQAVVLQARGDLRGAVTQFEKALSLRKQGLGANHPDVAQTLLGLAAAKLGLGDVASGLRALSEARAGNEALLHSIAGSGAGEERLDGFLRSLRAEEDLTYSLLSDPSLVAREDVAAHVATTALLRKGRSVDEAADTSRALYQGLGPEEKQKLARLREVRSRRADLALAGSGLYSAEEYQRLLRELQSEEEQQQEALLRSSATLRDRLPRYIPERILSDVQSRIPSGAILIEILAYRRYTFRPSGKATLQLPGTGPLRYGALVLAESGPPRAFDLGEGATIDQAVASLLSMLTQVDSSWQPAAQKLSGLVLTPMASALSSPKRWYIAADAQLNLVPFAVLPFAAGSGSRKDGDPLVEKIDLSYLTSGRDLLREAQSDTARSSLALLADPQFAVLSSDASASASQRTLAGQRTAGAFRGLRLGKVAPLPGTREEAQSIEKLLKRIEIKSLYGVDAKKAAFLAIEQPGILHIATHGLFIGESARGGDTSRGLVLDEGDVPGAATAAPSSASTPETTPSSQTTPSGAPKSAYAGNPLLGSMLVLAGAETAAWLPPEQRDPALGNGLVTALEVASMNLWGTQLVVLSACDTGRGDVSHLGQGVYGLRRAVMVAGAETLLTSLWKVDDKATRDLMERYYKNLLKGRSRSDAMREAALHLRKGRPHPYYWAPFIPIGRAAPLVGVGKSAAKSGRGSEAESDP
jgi:CHAT domain-containing protein/Flp pilus assembly protein TadD